MNQMTIINIFLINLNKIILKIIYLVWHAVETNIVECRCM